MNKLEFLKEIVNGRITEGIKEFAEKQLEKEIENGQEQIQKKVFDFKKEEGEYIILVGKKEIISFVQYCKNNRVPISEELIKFASELEHDKIEDDKYIKYFYNLEKIDYYNLWTWENNKFEEKDKRLFSNYYWDFSRIVLSKDFLIGYLSTQLDNVFNYEVVTHLKRNCWMGEVKISETRKEDNDREYIYNLASMMKVIEDCDNILKED